MEQFINFASLGEALKVIEKMYDKVRLVDPFGKRVIVSQSGQGKITELADSACYAFWQQGRTCNNCVSARALNEDDAFVKIEFNGKRIFLVNALPVRVGGERIVLELLKDITDHGIIDFSFNGFRADKIQRIIQRRNTSVVSDDLTGVYNRRFIYERLPFDILQSVTEKKPLTVFMADLDEFKKINDSYGHVAGDYALKSFARVLKSCVRKDRDWVARYGGDEFLVVLGATDSKEAYQIVERMRQKVQMLKLEYEGQTMKFTASFGGCVLLSEGMAVENLIACADKKLYRAKQEGRNRVCL